MSSVGHSVREEKNAAKKPAHAFPIELNSSTLGTPVERWIF